MNLDIITNKSNLNKNNIFENIFDYEEYYLIKEKAAYKFIIGKRSNDIIIKCKNYELTLSNNDLSVLTKSILNTIDDAFFFIINIFEENKVIIKDIIINKTITLLLNIYVYNKSRDIEMILLYNKSNKDLFFNELNNNYNNLKEDISYLKNEINILKYEINQLKKDNINNNDKEIINNKIDEINDNKIKELNESINNKYKELKKNIINIEYRNKKNYKFKRDPQHLIYKLNIYYRYNDYLIIILFIIIINNY